METHKVDLREVVQVLEEGFDCQKSRRKEWVMERCLASQERLLRIVVANSFDHFSRQDVWVLIPVSITKWPRGLKGEKQR